MAAPHRSPCNARLRPEPHGHTFTIPKPSPIPFFQGKNSVGTHTHTHTTPPAPSSTICKTRSASGSPWGRRCRGRAGTPLRVPSSLPVPPTPPGAGGRADLGSPLPAPPAAGPGAVPPRDELSPAARRGGRPRPCGARTGGGGGGGGGAGGRAGPCLSCGGAPWAWGSRRVPGVG